jgi:AAA family ATP:ADP antiporter
MTAFVQRILNVRRGEVAPLLVSAFYFFCVLTAIGVMRPARDAIGMRGGLDSIRWLFIGTAVVTLAVNPMFGLLVSRFRRMVFIAVTYLFFAASLVGFYLLIEMAPDAVGNVSGRVFYVWYSVFNLFSTMVFWALMADRFSLEQSRRLFGAIAVGGTIGAIVGPRSPACSHVRSARPRFCSSRHRSCASGWLAAWLVTRLQPAVNAEGARCGCLARSRSHRRQRLAGDRSRAAIALPVGHLAVRVADDGGCDVHLLHAPADGGCARAGHDTRGHRAGTDRHHHSDRHARAAASCHGHLIKRFGVAVALIVLPVVASLGFIGLAIVSSFATLIVFDAFFRAIQRAITRPARETLFTVVSREDKYKSKAVTDTFVYRGGDLLGAWTEGWLGQLGLGLIGLAGRSCRSPLVGLLGVWLGRRQDSMRADRASEPASAPARPLTSPVA